MTRTAPNRRVDNVAASLHHLAVHITRAVEHVHAELDQLGAFPSDTLPEHTSGGDATSTWPPDSVLTAYELRSRREDIRDWILPNFYFHATLAYALLRAAGLPIGKMDFIPHMAGHRVLSTD